MSKIDEILNLYTPPPLDLVGELAVLLQAVAESAALQGQPNVVELIVNDLRVQARFKSFSRSLKDTAQVESALIEYARQEGEDTTKVISKDTGNSRGWPIFRRIV